MTYSEENLRKWLYLNIPKNSYIFMGGIQISFAELEQKTRTYFKSKENNVPWEPVPLSKYIINYSKLYLYIFKSDKSKIEKNSIWRNLMLSEEINWWEASFWKFPRKNPTKKYKLKKFYIIKLHYHDYFTISKYLGLNKQKESGNFFRNSQPSLYFENLVAFHKTDEELTPTYTSSYIYENEIEMSYGPFDSLQLAIKESNKI